MMVGEIRDTETIEIAVKAALTGHLVLSTLHTNDAASTVTRMVDMGVDPFMVSSSTLLVSAQRLMRRLCEHCRRPVEAPPERLLAIGYTEEEATSPTKFFTAVGCPRCNQGYTGRFAILETLPIRDEIKQLIVEGRSALDIKNAAVDARHGDAAPLRAPERAPGQDDDRGGAPRHARGAPAPERRRARRRRRGGRHEDHRRRRRACRRRARRLAREPTEDRPMPNYKYSAVGSDGRTVSGRLDAASKTDCVAELRKRSLTPIDIQEKSGGSSPSPSPSSSGFAPEAGPSGPTSAPVPASKAKKAAGRFGAVKPGVRKKEEIVIFTRQLATMISAGIPMLESLEILKEQAESKQFSLLVDRVIEDVRSGKDLSSAIERHPKAFTEVYVSMVRAGEASGQIDEILVRLADYLEASQKLSREIRSAMTYPIVSLVMIFGITAYLMIGIVPKFKEVFDSLDIDLPGLTKAILGTSRFCEDNWMMVIVGIMLVIGGLVTYKRTDKGGWQFDWLMLHLPVFGPLFRKVGLSRFSKTCATMIKSGVPILGTLEIVADTAGNRLIAEAVERARESVRQGESLMVPLSESPVFPPMVTRMIGIGEKTGSLETLLEKISEFYDDQVSATVKQLTSLIEPLMIAVMGVMVGTIVLAVFLPIFELQKNLAAH